MQWSTDKTQAPRQPQQLYLPIIIDPEYHYEAVNVEIQEQKPLFLALVDAAHDCSFGLRFRAFGRKRYEICTAR